MLVFKILIFNVLFWFSSFSFEDLKFETSFSILKKEDFKSTYFSKSNKIIGTVFFERTTNRLNSNYPQKTFFLFEKKTLKIFCNSYYYKLNYLNSTNAIFFKFSLFKFIFPFPFFC